MSIDKTVTQLRARPDALIVEWSDGASAEFASVWLQDNLRKHRDPHSGQRLVDIMDLPESPAIRAVLLDGDRVCVEWQGDTLPALFEVDWLAAHAAPLAQRRRELKVMRWLDGASRDAATEFGWSTLSALADASTRREWLVRLLQQGIAFVRDVPSTDGAILDAVSSLGQVAETNYGRVFDVRSVPQPENLAYSDLGLGLHTDNPYREPVPGFQALHVLIASPDGGDSLFADGFAIAEHLREVDPHAFDVLTRTPVPFLYRTAQTELYAERPLIRLSCDGAVAAVHYNNRSIAPFEPTLSHAQFYSAYRRFAGLLREPRFMMQLRLRDGDLVVFDNQRTLHGRTAFTSAHHPRHLRGCYLTRDSVFSAAAVLERARLGSSA